MRTVYKCGNSTISRGVRISALMSLTTGEEITTHGKLTAQEPVKGKTTGTNQKITAGRKLIIMDIN